MYKRQVEEIMIFILTELHKRASNEIIILISVNLIVTQKNMFQRILVIQVYTQFWSLRSIIVDLLD